MTDFAHLGAAPTVTGNLVVSFERDLETASAKTALESVGNMRISVSSDYSKENAASEFATDGADCIILEHLKVAVIRPPAGASMSALSTTLAAHDAVKSLRPEFHLFTYEVDPKTYSAWVRQGLQLLIDQSSMPSLTDVAPFLRANQFADTSEATWGIQAINAHLSPFTGKGIKVAILDTGLDLTHPDFQTQTIKSASFVPGQFVQDGQGHGTHCIGTSCGPTNTRAHPRYGVAPEAEIHVGKVLSDQGSGQESWIWAGMNWAIEQGCQVISMSLGRATQPGEQPDPIYTDIGQAALDAGSLIIAAAGNDSARRFHHIAPVSSPANAPTIMAVGAVNSAYQPADFSNGGINGNGGDVDICAPGASVFSSVPMPLRYRALDGTSMATPHVAGVAALLAQSDSNLRGQALWNALQRTTQNIALPARDGGAGLVQAPVQAPMIS